MSAQLATTKRTPSQALKSITAVAGRKGVSVRRIDGEIVVSKGGKQHAFPSADKAAAFLLACGVL